MISQLILFVRYRGVRHPTRSFGAVAASIAILFAISPCLPGAWAHDQVETTSIWGSSAVPAQLDDPDRASVLLGTRFRSATAGVITAIRFYRHSSNHGPHVGILWDYSGNKLATVEFPSTSSVGWLRVDLRAPVPIAANRDYVVSYWAPMGGYSTTIGAFAQGRTIDSGPLTATAGVYSYEGRFPTLTWRSASYLVDVEFAPQGGTEPPVPTLTPTPTPTATPTSTPTPTPTSTPSSGDLALPRIPWEGGPAYYEKYVSAAGNGWTDPGFLPIAVWWGGLSTDAEAQWDKNHGINTYILLDQNNSMATPVMDRNGMSYFGGQLANMTRTSRSWVGDFLDDEVDGRFSPQAGADHLSGLIAALPDHNKVRYANYTSMIVNSWFQDPDAFRYVNSYTDAVSIDMYWYTIPFCDWSPYPGDYYFLTPFPKPTCRTSHSYGQTVNMLRSRDAQDGKLQPIWNFIESVSGAPAEDGNPPLMTPDRIKGAAMSSIINEARGLVYFNQSFQGPCSTGNAVRTAQNNRSWSCSNLIEAMGEVNRTILDLAPVINTQSFQWDFGVGLDTMFKAKDGYAYIFAMTDGTAGSRTLSLPPAIRGSSLEVLNEHRTLPVVNGTFVDHFATEATYHIYRVRV